MESKPRVSIIIAVMNQAGNMRRCIESIAAQTYPNLELIVMDGGSTDGTIEALKANASRIAYWESKPDRGIFHAWNKGLEHAHGEWICFLGSDDQWAEPNSLERLVAAAREDGDVVSGRGAYIDEHGNRVRLFGEPWTWENVRHDPKFCHPGMLQRRRLFDRFGNFGEQWRVIGDYEFHLRLGPETKATFVDEVIILLGDAGISHARWKQSMLERFRAQSRCMEIGPVRAFLNVALTSLKIFIKRVTGKS